MKLFSLKNTSKVFFHDFSFSNSVTLSVCGTLVYDVDVVVDAFDVDDVDDIGSFVCRFSVLFLTLKWEKESDSAETLALRLSTRGPFS